MPTHTHTHTCVLCIANILTFIPFRMGLTLLLCTELQLNFLGNVGIRTYVRDLCIRSEACKLEFLLKIGLALNFNAKSCEMNLFLLFRCRLFSLNFRIVETRTVGTRLMYFISILVHFTIFPLGDLLHIFTEIQASTLPPPPGGGSGGATGRGGRPRRGAAAGVKMDAPAWGLSLSMLTDSWRSPRSSTKNFGEGDTTANGLL